MMRQAVINDKEIYHFSIVICQLTAASFWPVPQFGQKEITIDK
jgi:hypothetical protein